MAKGSDSDICRSVSGLSMTADQLQKQCQSQNEREFKLFNECFTKVELEEFLEDGSLIGKIEDACYSSQSKPSATKVALVETQTKPIDQLNEAINIERREKETLRFEIEQLKTIVNSEKASYKMLQVENDKLKQELDAQREAMDDMLDGKAHADWIDKIADIEQKPEEERDTWMEEQMDKIEAKQRLRHIQSEVLSESRWHPVLVQKIRTKAAEEKKKEIRGLAILNEELLVVNEKSSEVEVYDSSDLSFSRRWVLKELLRPKDIVTCKRNRCLYILDYKGVRKLKIVYRVDPNGKLINEWSIGDSDELIWEGSLSVTDESHVILALLWDDKLNEYSCNGQLVREIHLSDFGNCRPWHAIKLFNGHFLVSCGYSGDDSLHTVRLVDEDGKLRKSFGGKQMNHPVHLSVDENGFVMVVDQRHSRVLLLDSDLEFKKEILSSEMHELDNPLKILLDESHGRLFVADNLGIFSKEGHILMFELI